MEERIFFHIDVNSAFLSWTALSMLQEGAGTDLRYRCAATEHRRAQQHRFLSPLRKLVSIQ